MVEVLNFIEAKKILLFGQCYAGNILEFEIDNACVITANMKGLQSYTNPYNRCYDEFFYHFLSFIHGSYPDGEALSVSSENDVEKAFEYAVEMDVFAPESIIGKEINKSFTEDEKIVEIPQMKNNLEGMLVL